MRKEILFAILAGALFGLIIAFGIWKANSSLKPEGISDTNTEPQSLSSPQPSHSGITLVTPENYDVVDKDTLSIKGATLPDTWIAIQSEKQDYVIKSDNNGSFAQDVALITGINEVVISVLSDNQNKIEKKVVVIYSSEFNGN